METDRPGYVHTSRLSESPPNPPDLAGPRTGAAETGQNLALFLRLNSSHRPRQDVERTVGGGTHEQNDSGPGFGQCVRR